MLAKRPCSNKCPLLVAQLRGGVKPAGKPRKSGGRDFWESNPLDTHGVGGKVWQKKWQNGMVM